MVEHLVYTNIYKSVLFYDKHLKFFNNVGLIYLDN